MVARVIGYRHFTDGSRRLHYVQTCYFRMDGGIDVRVVATWERSIERAQKRYLSAIKALTVVRGTLAMDKLQVNVVKNQVNLNTQALKEPAIIYQKQAALPFQGALRKPDRAAGQRWPSTAPKKKRKK